MHFPSLLSVLLPSFTLLAGCSAGGGPEDDADFDSAGGSEQGNSGGAEPGAGGLTAAGGLRTRGGSGGIGSGGESAQPAGGQAAAGGISSAGGSPNGGAPTGGSGSGGSDIGGAPDGGSSSGGSENGGDTGGSSAGGGEGSETGGASSGGAPPAELDCDAAMPTSGATQHSSNGTGDAGDLTWEIWSNTGNGELTTYDVPAFIASWNEAGGYLGRVGLEWGCFNCDPVPYEDHGTITAQFVSRKSGTAGGYSYVGMYGWSTDPCIEWYVVEDSYGNMPINPGNTNNEGEVEIDGGTYIMYTRPTTGTGGDRCGGLSDWMQYYSVRKTARACGQISLTEHFDAWKTLGMPMGDLLEAKILVEVGGGTGNVELPIANVTATQ